jgi:hypothetical protein
MLNWINRLFGIGRKPVRKKAPRGPEALRRLQVSCLHQMVDHQQRSGQPRRREEDYENMGEVA